MSNFFGSFLFPCSNASCMNWDSDKSGGHCMCAKPPCLQFNQIKPCIDNKICLQYKEMGDESCCTCRYHE